ncbi:hydrolase [Curtanaerobium respiraculi]|uniref:hydrolase n=1 Tax=Curtanaerobium respiraculi TaxID=2949669 RepID=UPI0024B3A28A|nr:hydrolase [Curtanaerobium respiraculi]
MERRALRSLPAFLAIVCALAIAPVPAAFADETSSENVINTQQMPDSSFLYDTSIYDLANADTSYDDAIVQVTGEVVGDAISDSTVAGKTWITLSSLDANREGSIAVLIDDDDLDLIDTYGKYGATGTTLTVKGTFHLACGVHEGATDIHADEVKATAAGKATPDVFDIHDFIPGIVLVFVGALLTLLYHWMRERQR